MEVGERVDSRDDGGWGAGRYKPCCEVLNVKDFTEAILVSVTCWSVLENQIAMFFLLSI